MAASRKHFGGHGHAVTEDDVYMGYHIPRDATIMLNIWAINRDPERHLNPTAFMPERYLGDTTTSAENFSLADVSQRDHFTFGAGRRVCPGSHIVEHSMFLAISRIFWAFDVSPKRDADGEVKLPVQDVFTQSFVAIPERFEVDITPRSERKAEIVRREWEVARKGLDEDGQFLVNPI